MTRLTTAPNPTPAWPTTGRPPQLRFLVPLGRLLYVAIFLLSAPNDFKRETIDMAAKQGLPMANVLVPLAGVIALVGGLSVLLGCYARIGALLLLVFLIPVTLQMHAFWSAPADQFQMQMINFMKNLSMMGTALLIIYFGAGPISLDARRPR